MKNSEVSEPSLEHPADGLRGDVDGVDLNRCQETTGNSGTKTPEDATEKKRAKPARKEGKRPIHESVSVEDQLSKEDYMKLLNKLESQHFVVSADKLEDPSQCEDAPFYCELCTVKITSVKECQNHVITRVHKKAKKAKGGYMSLCRVKPPSQSQIVALDRLLATVFREHGLCPVKDLPVRHEVAEDVHSTVSVIHPECTVSLYGSSFTGFGLKGSDVNLDLVIPEEGNVPHVLLSILDLLQKDEYYCEVTSEFDAKVPRILFKHVSSGLSCELSPGNVNAYKTGCLLKKYNDIDPRVRLLTVGLRYWARVCGVDCQADGGLPGYSFALIVIQFLQETKPPVLPRWIPSEVIEENNPNASTDFVRSNEDETGSLWFQLFRFYCIDFDMPSLVISIKEPMPLKRQDKKWGQKRIAVEDPFSTKRNVASSLSSDKAWEYFFTCWKNSFSYWSSLSNNSLKKPLTEVPTDDRNALTKNKSNNESLKNKYRPKELENHEEDIFEMDDLDHTTKQMDSMEISGVDRIQAEISSRQQSEKGLVNVETVGQGDTLSESEDENASEPGSKRAERDRDAAVDSKAERKSNASDADSTNAIAAQEVEYRFDATIFRGNSRPVKTCCYCKDDGHVKENCPDLRKPALRKLPQMTAQFGAMLDYACKTCRADFEFAKGEEAHRERVLKNLEDYIHEIFPEARLFLFGSSKNGFGFRNSDIDICMTLENHVKEEVDAVQVITDLAKLLKKHRDCGSVLAITTAKVPIVKFYLRSCKREADISLYNTLALENTAMLATYAKLDDRVATLGYTVKVFAKVCDIGDASKGSLSSYAYILMLLHYLQQCQPPVIPVLQSLYTENKQPEKIVDDWNCWFCSDLNKINTLWKPKERNNLSAGLLWYGFLRYYTETFDFEHDVVCCRRTKKLTKFEKMWTKHVFAIEDPFNLDHNLGAGVTRKMANFIMTTFIRGRERFGFPCHGVPIELLQRYFFDVYYLTDGYEAPNDRNCRVCGKIGHIAKDCPHSKSNKRAEQKKDEEERKARQPEATEKSVLSSKPLGAGAPRQRSSSTPTERGQNQTAVDGATQPTARPTNIPALQEDSVITVSSSEVEPQFTEKASELEDDNSVNACGSPSLEVPQTLTQVRNLQTNFVDVNAAASQQGKIIDPNRTHSQPPLPIVPQAVVTNDTEANLTPVLSPSVSPVRTQRASFLPNPSQSVNPPPGFYAPNGARQGPYTSGSPHTIAASMSPTPSGNRPGAAYVEGQAISQQTPPGHHPFMFNPPNAHFVRSPNQMWLQQQQALVLAHHSPLVRPLVPYPLTPEAQLHAQFQQVRGLSDNLPIGLASSPVHGQQPPKHNSEMIPQSPPNISRNVMWPVGRSSPTPGGINEPLEGQLPYPRFSSPGLPVPTIGSPRQMMHHHASPGSSVGTPGADLGSPQYNAHPQVSGSLQQMPQQLPFPHSPGMPAGLVSTPRPLHHPPVPPQQVPWQHRFGTHMTGEQFINLVRAAEEEFEKSENARKSLEDHEPEDLKQLAPKDPKVAKTPEEHQLLSKLSKVKSLWEGGSSPEMEDNLSPMSADTGHATLQEKGDVVHSDPDGKLPVTGEAWIGPENDGRNGESNAVCAEEKEDISSEVQTRFSTSIKDSCELSSDARHDMDVSSPSRPLDADEKVQSESSGKEERHERLTTEPISPKTQATEERPKQKRTRQDERGRKPWGSSDESTPERPEEMGSGDPPKKGKRSQQRRQQKNYSDFKGSGNESTPGKPEKTSPGDIPRERNKQRQAHQKNYDDFTSYGNDGTPEKPDKKSPGDIPRKRNKQPQGHQKNYDDFMSSGNETAPEKPEKKSPSDIPRERNKQRQGHQKNYNDFMSSGNETAPGKPEKKSPGDIPSERNKQRQGHQKNYDHSKSSRKERAPKKPEEKPPGDSLKKGKDQPQGHRSNDDIRGFRNERAPGKPKEKFPSDSPKKGENQQRGYEKNFDDFRVEALKSSPAVEKPRRELSERVEGVPQNAASDPDSRPSPMTKPKESRTSGNGGDMKRPEGNKQEAAPRGPDNSLGASNKGGRRWTPNRRRRPPRSRTKSGGPAAEDESRKRSNSTPEKRSSKNS